MQTLDELDFFRQSSQQEKRGSNTTFECADYMAR